MKKDNKTKKDTKEETWEEFQEWYKKDIGDLFEDYTLELDQDELDELKYCLYLEIDFFENTLKETKDNKTKKSLKESIEYSKELLDKLNKVDNQDNIKDIFVSLEELKKNKNENKIEKHYS